MTNKSWTTIDKLDDSLGADVEFQKAMLDALVAHIALLDRQGTIIAVNASWQQFGEENGLRDSRFGVGANYFAACRAAADPGARAAASGIQDVLSGQQPSFYFEYPCHSPDEERWFALRATPLAGHPGFAVVAHENVTQCVRAERSNTDNPDAASNVNVTRRFPRSRDRIRMLFANNPLFREICEDYESLACWVDEQQHDHSLRSEIAHARELIEDLAREITVFLGADGETQ